MKTCTLCKTEKDESFFRFQKTRNYLTARCKKCEGITTRERSKKTRKIKGTYAWFYKKYRKLRDNARRRGITFELSFNEFKELKTQETCTYCLKPASIKTVDRINNLRGYTKDNCVLSCYKCNTLKGSLVRSDILMLKRIILLIETQNPQK